MLSLLSAYLFHKKKKKLKELSKKIKTDVQVTGKLVPIGINDRKKNGGNKEETMSTKFKIQKRNSFSKEKWIMALFITAYNYLPADQQGLKIPTRSICWGVSITNNYYIIFPNTLFKHWLGKTSTQLNFILSVQEGGDWGPRTLDSNNINYLICQRMINFEFNY